MTRLSQFATIFFAVAATCIPSLLVAQPVPPGKATGAPANVFPRVRLTYYVEQESNGHKEVRFANLTEWTIDKDVYIELVPNEEAGRSFAPAPDTAARLAPDFARSRLPRHIWRIRYEPAAKEGVSRLFVHGLRGRMGRARIYSEDDLIVFINITGSGWRELGAEGRVARYLASRVPASNRQLPTRSQ